MMKNSEMEICLFDGRLMVNLENTFHEMAADKMEYMYPYEERPQIILEDETMSRFCTFSLLKGQSLSKAQMKSAVNTLSKVVVSLHPSCRLTEPRLIELKCGTCGWFSFKTTGIGNLYNIMYILGVDGCMMLGTMGCHIEDEKGKEQLMRIMMSLEVPEKIPPYKKTIS